MSDQDEIIRVKVKWEVIPDSKRAADLFSRILQAVRSQTAEDQQKARESEGLPPAAA